MPHASPHHSKVERSLWSSNWSAMERIGWYMRQSMANNLTCEVTTLGRSFICMRNNNGPKTVPWGTPDRTLHGEDLLPSTTVCSRVLKKAAVQSSNGPCMPKNRSLPNKRSWGTMSKAFEKSRIATSVWILQSLASSRSWSVRSNLVSQESFAQKPWFNGVKIPYCSKCVLKCLQMIYSRILHDTQVKETGW